MGWSSQSPQFYFHLSFIPVDFVKTFLTYFDYNLHPHLFGCGLEHAISTISNYIYPSLLLTL